MNLARLPFKFFDSLNLKVFACNHRRDLPPNLWCVWSTNLDPQILYVSEQHVVFSLNFNSTIVCMAAVYASNCHISRRNIWNSLTKLISVNGFPWCIVGDFNAIQSAHEQIVRNNPNMVHMMDFTNWSNSNNLIDIPTKSNFFTWSNGREDRYLVERRLERAFCNQLWLSSTTNMTVSTLIMLRSDHYPLLLDFSFSQYHHYSSFRFLGMLTLHEKCEALIAKCWSVQVIGCLIYVLSKKLQLLKTWNREFFSNIHALVQTAIVKLANIQSQLIWNGDNKELKDQ